MSFLKLSQAKNMSSCPAKNNHNQTRWNIYLLAKPHFHAHKKKFQTAATRSRFLGNGHGALIGIHPQTKKLNQISFNSKLNSVKASQFLGNFR